jgi:hypothetical protein
MKPAPPGQKKKCSIIDLLELSPYFCSYAVVPLTWNMKPMTNTLHHQKETQYQQPFNPNYGPRSGYASPLNFFRCLKYRSITIDGLIIRFLGFNMCFWYSFNFYL